jgi:ABC-type Mn2+/Zn2+ transport system permease subunit
MMINTITMIPTIIVDQNVDCVTASKLPRISFTAFLATGVILISLINSTTDLYHILFGNLLAVTQSTFWSTIIVGIIVMESVVLLIKLIKITPVAKNAVKLIPMAASGLVLLFLVMKPMKILAIIPVINAPINIGIPNKNDNATPDVVLLAVLLF